MKTPNQLLAVNTTGESNESPADMVRVDTGSEKSHYEKLREIGRNLTIAMAGIFATGCGDANPGKSNNHTGGETGAFVRGFETAENSRPLEILSTPLDTNNPLSPHFRAIAGGTIRIPVSGIRDGDIVTVRINAIETQVTSQGGFVPAVIDMNLAAGAIVGLEVERDDGTRATIPNAVEVLPPPPVISTFTPTGGLHDQPLTITIQGDNFVDGRTTASVGGQPLTNVTITNGVTLTGMVASLPVGPDLRVEVVTPGGSFTAAQRFNSSDTIAPPTPRLHIRELEVTQAGTQKGVKFRIENFDDNGLTSVSLIQLRAGSPTGQVFATFNQPNITGDQELGALSPAGTSTVVVEFELRLTDGRVVTTTLPVDITGTAGARSNSLLRAN